GTGASSNQVYFGTTPTLSSANLKGTQSATIYSPGALAAGATFYWRIDELNSAGVTPGTVWNFTTLGSATNPSPAFGTTGVSTNPSLTWTASLGATSHQVYFGTSATLNSSNLKTNQTGTTYNPGALIASMTYYWRIDEVSSLATNNGPVWSF